MEEYVRLNVVFKPPKKAIEEAIKLSKENEVFFILDGLKFHPHMTIYSPEYPRSNVDKVLESVEEIVKNISPITFKFNKVSGGQGFVSVKFDNSPTIKRIHEEIVEKLNPLREGRIREKYGADYHMNFNEEQIENIKKYGYPDAMNRYSPHLSIIRLEDGSLVEEVSKKINWSIAQFTVDKIAVYEMGEHGTCIKLIKEFELKWKK
ncbi:MAG: 2'-5' RNA ligase family protein [Candidatus Woesearchaeota archaeon]|nr:MAG: 2'-5' RNA ligase family protein [Candidatus Woesearchaeota archaeon]